MRVARSNEHHRKQPSNEKLSWRAGFLSAMRQFCCPDKSLRNIPSGLSEGNSKTGRSGSFFSSVFVWNLPSVACCPGASHWCLSHCYTADERIDISPIREWADNWYWVESHPEVLKRVILNQIRQATPPVAVRLHSSGDFYSVAYIAFWETLVRETPSCSYWGYTRSWSTESLLTSLEALRHLPNVQLFASWDATMPPAPIGWRTATVVNTLDEGQYNRHNSLSCPEELDGGPTCASCRFCITSDDRNVLFTLH